MTEKIEEILEVIRIVQEKFQENPDISIHETRVKATKSVADLRGIANQTVLDKFIRELQPSIKRAAEFDSFLEEWLVDGSDELRNILLRHSNDSEDNRKIIEAFYSKGISRTAILESRDEEEQLALDEIGQETPLDAAGRERLKRELENAKPTLGHVNIRGRVYKRDNKAIADLKKYRGYGCQIPNCHASILRKNGHLYVEAAHIKSKHEKGSELYWNMLVLCPNHHKEFDMGNREIVFHTRDNLEFRLNWAHYTIPLSL